MSKKITLNNLNKKNVNENIKIRPKKLFDFIGQSNVCNQMEIFIKSAKKRKESLDHILIYGPPGVGKTTLAIIIANEMNSNIRTTSGPIIEKPGDLAAILTNLKKNDILFIDEIHRISPVIEELLYPAMEDYQLDILIGEGPAARSIKLELPNFTLIGATTRAGLLTSPLRDRFGIIQYLDFYNISDLTKIVIRSANFLSLFINEKSCNIIASRARGTPRIANRLLRRVRDFAEIYSSGKINDEVTTNALNMLNVDTAGFDFMDRKLLLTIIENFVGGPVGLSNLAATIGEDCDTIEELLEPFLIQKGFIKRTPRGRIATEHAYKHFGLNKNL